MSYLKKCLNCKKYTIKDVCSACGEKVNEVTYRFVQIRDAPKNSAEHFARLRKKE